MLLLFIGWGGGDRNIDKLIVGTEEVFSNHSIQNNSIDVLKKKKDNSITNLTS